MRALSIASIAALTLGLTQFASAADLAVKSPPPVPVAPAWSWTGFYVGGNLGYSTGVGTNQNSNAKPPMTANHIHSRRFGGAPRFEVPDAAGG